MTAEKRRKVSFQTVGCRLNQYETEKMAADLSRFGFERVLRNEPADLYIINTCTVTHKADKDSRYLARKAKRDNPRAKVVLVGCYVETDPEKVLALPEVDVVIRNSEKEFLCDLLPPRLPDLFSGLSSTEPTGLAEFYQRNRAWIKISDGCNQTCAYCLVTIVRGNLKCRPADDIVAEVKSLVGAGYREIVLTAVNMGYYQDPEHQPPIRNLAGLCRLLLSETEIYRLRLSSIEPQTIDDDLIELYRTAGHRICRHWHIPLQAGSDRILKLMRRPYNREQFAAKLSRLYQARPGTVIGADVIVGFPGETEAEFEQAIELVERAGLNYLHVFSYSDRPGTAAAAMPDKTAPEEIRHRAKLLTALSRERLRLAHLDQVGDTLEVISEFKHRIDGRHLGISDNYLRVTLPSDLDSGKKIVKVRIESATPEHLLGSVIDC
ncbi:MAG TPA: tRNA (N(6)-L-threonylcarbamoyladenosine(37)-C(2))-methylthiotransferase MtaB [candidate division Zixibacteria bacterium]|nr:tRNA (N(6)-L-threonylcarbamoyladenosine(37)-C(2))-methylthiotransferase MtaB [candidate division Zixibacteria bacterium]